MAPAVARALPEKRAVVQPGRIVDRFNPGFGGFVNDSVRLAVFGVGEVQIQKCLFAILRLINDLRAVRCPRYAHDQQIGRLILVSVHPARRAARCVNDAKLHNRVWIAGNWDKE